MLLFLREVDCQRQYIRPGQNFTGTWEIEGDTRFNSEFNSIELIKNKSKSLGALWKTNSLPSYSWSGNCTILFDESSFQSEVGLWITHDFGIYGAVFGGPNPFNGIGVLVLYTGSEIQVEVRENDGSANYPSYRFVPNYESDITNPEVTFFLKYDMNNFSVEIEHDSKRTVIFNRKPKKSIRKYIFSITGQGMKPGYSIFALSSKFDYDSLQFSNDDEKHSISLLNRLKEKSQFTTSEILDIIDEFAQASSNLESSETLQQFLHKSVVPFTDDWQRRDLNIIEQLHQIGEKIHSNLQSVSLSVDQILLSLDKYMFKLKNATHHLEDELYFGVLEGYKLNRDLRMQKKQFKKGGLPLQLIYFCGFEIFLLTLFLFYSIFRNKKINY